MGDRPPAAGTVSDGAAEDRPDAPAESPDTSASESRRVDRTTETRRSARRADRRSRRWPRIGSIVAIVALIGVVAWYVVDTRRDPSSESADTPEPVALSPAALKTLAATLGQPIYWIGERPSTTYEVMQTTNRNVYVRYLPAGTDVGDPGSYTTVGTYPVRNAYDIIDGKTRDPGSTAVAIPGGGVGLATKNNPTNVYAAYPGSDYQVEIFSPVPQQARKLLQQLHPVGGPVVPGTTSGAAGVSANRLKALASSLGQPIYWAGARPRTTYEFTRVENGNIFVRYLPRGTPVGSSEPHLTVSTYPFQGALAATKRAASKKGAVKIPIGGGAIAFHNRKKPTNVYVAFPGSDYQVEVYDPKPDAARKLVAAQSIAPVR